MTRKARMPQLLATGMQALPTNDKAQLAPRCAAERDVHVMVSGVVARKVPGKPSQQEGGILAIAPVSCLACFMSSTPFSRTVGLESLPSGVRPVV